MALVEIKHSFLALVPEGKSSTKTLNETKTQRLVSQKSLFYTSRFLACGGNLQQSINKKKKSGLRETNQSHQSGYSLHRQPKILQKLINSGETFRSLSGPGCDLSQEIRSNIRFYSDTVSAHATK